MAFFFAGCDSGQITSYQAPKTKVVAHEEHATPDRPRPQLSWKLPTGWQEAPAGRMSLASFTIAGDTGRQAQVSITALAPLAGRESIIINMWREQVGLAAIGEAEAGKSLQPVEVGSEQGKLFEIAAPARGGDSGTRIVTAMVHHSDASWFYKLSGDAATVEKQKPAFIEFLKSIRVKEGAAETESAGSSFKWKVPAQWQAIPAGQMQAAKFSVPARGAAKAEVSVSIFPSDTGGMLANVNRWRGQLGLGPVTESDLAGLVSTLDAAHPQAILVDMKNNDRQLVGAVVPRGGQWFFYKLLGGADAVTPEKDAFVAFVKSEP